jgi:hypothetical protein
VTNTRAPYRLCSVGVGAETYRADGVRRKAPLQVAWSALHRVFNRSRLKTKHFQKKKENTCQNHSVGDELRLSGTGDLPQILVRAEQPSYGKKKRPPNLLDGRFSLSLLGF